MRADVSGGGGGGGAATPTGTGLPHDVAGVQSPAAGPVVDADVTFTDLAVASSVAIGALSAQSGAVRVPNGQGVIARNPTNAYDHPLITQSGSYAIAGDGTNGLGVQLRGLVGHYFRIGGLDTLTITAAATLASQPILGDSDYASPYGVHGEASIALADAARTETAANFRYQNLAYTGALTARRAITLPAPASLARAYEKTITNGTTGGFALRMTTGAGATVDVPPGGTKTLLFDSGGVRELAAGAALDVFANRPAAGINGRRYTARDSIVEWVDDGAAWRPIVPPGVVGTQPPAAAAFTKLAGTSATLVDRAGTLELTSDTGNELFDFGALGATFQVDVAFMTSWNTKANGSESLFALAFRNSLVGSFYRFGVYAGLDGSINVQSQNFSDVNTNSGGPTASVKVLDARGPFFLRAVRDANNITFSWSTNGQNWRQLIQFAKATFTAADHLALFTNTTGGNVTITDVLSLQVQ